MRATVMDGAGYRAMDKRDALKVLARPCSCPECSKRNMHHGHQ
ncbi:hypothetical protein [Corallococcus carmarthensis]|nr:hypothetical protein [Corallococcus carmarthensis]